jgi:hypothetical protein
LNLEKNLFEKELWNTFTTYNKNGLLDEEGFSQVVSFVHFYIDKLKSCINCEYYGVLCNKPNVYIKNEIPNTNTFTIKTLSCDCWSLKK